jgi:hypothetical protein
VPRIVLADYFSSGNFKETGEFGFRSFTCLGCSHRSATWEAFREHRRTCTGEMWRTGAPMPTITDDDRDALADLLAQVEDDEVAA